jgi:N-acetylglucosamine-6-phosphate deacetylase
MELRGAIPTAGLADGIVTVDSGVITGVAAATGGTGAAASDDVILPGLIDIHCHGGGGHSFATFSAPEARAAADFHARHGTTGVLASLVTAAPADLLGQVRALAPLVADGTLLGLHLEGPFLSPARRGAHAAALLRDPDPSLVSDLLSAAGGAIKIVTLAPERTGAAAVASMLRDAGVTVAFGHTDTDYDGMAAALTAAARSSSAGSLASGALASGALVTHLGNAMAPLHHRAAGPVAAALVAASADAAWVELIADGVHVDPGFTRLVFATAAPGRVILVTDAMAAAGMPDGGYTLGPLRVTVSGGVARLAGPDGGGGGGGGGGGSIAGGTRTLLEVVAIAVGSGVPLPEAVRAASESPADVLGRPLSANGSARGSGHGSGGGLLAPGMPADLVVADAELRARRVMRAGRWLG